MTWTPGGESCVAIYNDSEEEGGMMVRCSNENNKEHSDRTIKNIEYVYFYLFNALHSVKVNRTTIEQ